MAQSVAVSFTSAVAGLALGVRSSVGDSFAYSVSGTFVANLYLERSVDGGESWKALAGANGPGKITGAVSGNIAVAPHPTAVPLYRFRCDAFTSGTAVTSLTKNSRMLQSYQSPDSSLIPFQVNDDGVPNLVRLAQQRLVTVGAKVGATSGAVVASADNKGIMATVPASQTASTIVVRLSDYKIGAALTGFSLQGNVISAGGTVTVDASLRSLTAASGGATDAAVSSAALTQVSVTANTLLSAVNAAISGFAASLVAGVSYYLLITVTTAASTSVELEGVVVTYNEA